MKALLAFCLLTFAILSAQEIKQSGAFQWFQTDQEFSIEVNVDTGDLIAVRLTCDTGNYLKDCGRPEIDYGDGGFEGFDCPETWTIKDTTENACVIVASQEGDYLIFMPVLQRGIWYYGDYEVTAGP